MDNKCYYGSGRFYSDKYDKSTFPMPKDPTNITTEERTALIKFIAQHLKEEFQIGYLKDGYQFTVSTNKLQDQSDLGELKINVINEETASVKISLFNANAETISKQYPTAKNCKVDNFSITTVGGVGDIDETPHVLIFKHDDNAYGDTVVVCIGKNTSGFDAVWKQNAVTPFPCTYDLESLNSDGRLAMFIDCPKGTDWSALAAAASQINTQTDSDTDKNAAAGESGKE